MRHSKLLTCDQRSKHGVGGCHSIAWFGASEYLLSMALRSCETIIEMEDPQCKRGDAHCLRSQTRYPCTDENMQARNLIRSMSLLLLDDG